ncbi:6'-aminoglycoside N-acetyltransferase [Deinococcus aetherius]|uniref:6'-aminoglycoside N-acetyltransferase n=1 Tax=Deinococcus aetherius TaxID=200252 RepID=A0ABM8AE37_9DEIO|nr:phosphotransferase [Deinococcus aetherius]BDP42060.1 6'-aminoglycoside N-acetyltransferase [Deinococcus aetherius]
MAVPRAYLEKIRSVYPGLSLNTLDFNQDGMVNDVVVVNGEVVCRFGKHPWAAEALRQEARVLALAREYTSMRTPEFEHLEPEFVTYRFLPGEPLTRNLLLWLSPEARRAVLADLVTFLRQMHHIPRAAVEAAGLQASDAFRTREDWSALLAQAEEHLFPLLMRHQRAWLLGHFAPVLEDTLDLNPTPRLIHGDLGVYHVLFDPDARRLAGVIDFGTAGLGDPATDLAVLLSNYGESLVGEVLPAYPELTDHLDRARFWAGTLEVQWALAGLVHGDRALALAHLGGARDVLPLGR